MYVGVAKYRTEGVGVFPLDFVGARHSCLFTNVDKE